MTNSPPSNVNPCPELGPSEPARVLASGIDRLNLSAYLRWGDTGLFELLAEWKALAQSVSDGAPLSVHVDGLGLVVYEVKPNGSNGHEWVIVNREHAITLGRWQEPKQRPSASVDIRSEALWTHGPDAALDRALSLFRSFGASIERLLPSRVDMCVDVLVRERDWRFELQDQFVTRARQLAAYRSNATLSGFSIGSGDISARLYDKPLEIASKSKKLWMYPIWGIDQVPPDHRVIRVEFQLRREALKELGLVAWDDVPAKLPGLWAYCTTKWLRLVDDPALHHTQQTLLPWWEVVANGFAGSQGATPLVREEAVEADLVRNAQQAIGNLISVLALLSARPVGDRETRPARPVLRRAFWEAMRLVDLTDEELTDRLRSKQARHWRPKAGALNSTSVRCTGPALEA